MSDEANLSALYPDLGDPEARSGDNDSLLLASIDRKAAASRQANEEFFASCRAALLAGAGDLAESFAGGGRLFTMGNGGSSCDAAHVAVEFMHPVTAGRQALPAVSLAADIASVTAIGNDVGIDSVFVRQLEAQARRGDALMGFSTSGNSPNLLAAFRRARTLGLLTIGFAGADGGEMAKSGALDHILVVPTLSIHRVQECHVAAYHILWDLVHSRLAERTAGVQT